MRYGRFRRYSEFEKLSPAAATMDWSIRRPPESARYRAATRRALRAPNPFRRMWMPRSGRSERLAAESANRFRPPDLHENKQHPERNQCAAQVRQVWAQIMGHGPLPQNIGERSNNRQRPRLGHTLPSAYQVNQHPGRQKRKDRHDISDGSGQGVHIGSPVTSARPRIGAPSAP